LDLFIPGSSGLETLRRLNAPSYPAPILMMSADGCIATAVDLVRDGAYDFLEKPFSAAELVRRVERAQALFARKNPAHSSAPAHDPLTLREQEVLTQWVAGATSKEIARHFGISPRTIEIHRSKIMKKLHARNSAEIVQIAVSNAEEFGVHRRKTA
jgi:FixJ family two-component response regulator